MINKQSASHLPSLLKTLLLTSTLTLSLMFSAGSWAEWTEVGEQASGTNSFVDNNGKKRTYTNAGSKEYLDFDKIRKHDGYVSFWILTDHFEPDLLGTKSSKSYVVVDCQAFRSMYLHVIDYKQPMGEGDSWYEAKEDKPFWDSPLPNTAWETTLNRVCGL